MIAPSATEALVRARRTILVATIVLMAAAGILSTAAAVAVPLGLPYDEPWHWDNVRYFADHWRLPVLGEPGVGYQAQQTPLYYAIAAALTRITGEVLAVRLLGVAGFVALTGLTAAITVRVTRGSALVTIAATAFIALNPMLAVMSGSVQNDTWALVWGFAAILLAMRPLPGPRWLQGAVVGTAASLAILTKVSMVPLLIGILIAYALRRRFAEPIAALAVTGLATGWWFARNLVLYGDLTGQSAVVLTGAEFENAPSGPIALAQQVLTYLTLPTEYLRNTIAAPAWVDAVAVLVGGVLVLGLVLLSIREWRGCARGALLTVIAVAAVAVVAWLVQTTFGWPVAFRTAYAALPLFALCAGMATRVARPRWTGIGVVVVTSAAQLAAFGWVVASLASLDLPSPL